MSMPIATTEGIAFAFPDMCLTPAPPAPPVPIPYPNIADLSQASQASTNVTVGGKGVILANQTEVPTSSGNEAGTNGGLTSMTNMGKCKFPQGSSSVLINGKPVVRMMDPTHQNVGNSGPNAFGNVMIGNPQVLVGG